MDINQDRAWLAKPLDDSYDGAEPILQLKSTKLCSSGNLKLKFKEGNLVKFYHCLPKDRYSTLPEQAAFGKKFSSEAFNICDTAFPLMKWIKVT
jgi:hypothetical protein